MDDNSLCLQQGLPTRSVPTAQFLEQLPHRHLMKVNRHATEAVLRNLLEVVGLLDRLDSIFRSPRLHVPEHVLEPSFVQLHSRGLASTLGLRHGLFQVPQVHVLQLGNEVQRLGFRQHWAVLPHVQLDRVPGSAHQLASLS